MDLSGGCRLKGGCCCRCKLRVQQQLMRQCWLLLLFCVISVSAELTTPAQQLWSAATVPDAGLGAGEYGEQRFAWLSRYNSTTKSMSAAGRAQLT